MKFTKEQIESMPPNIRAQFEGIKKTKNSLKKTNCRISKAKLEMEMALKHGGYNYVKELEFHPTRKWRFDFAIESLKIAIEYEGIISEKSRHTTITGMSADCDKYNEAQRLGWKVFRFTALNYKNLLSVLKNT